MSHTNPSVKGELAVGIGSGFSVLPVGPDGQVLTADSGVAEGIKWAAAAGGAVFVQRTAIVNPATGSDATGAFGDWSKPYKTIQAACNAIPEGTTSSLVRQVWTILIAPGDYDEDLAIVGTRRKIALVGLGQWNLGTFAASGWAPSGVPRNITWTVTAGNVDSIRHSLMIGSLFTFANAAVSPPAYNTSPRISGKITCDNSAVPGGTTGELYVQAQVFDLGATGSSLLATAWTGILNWYSDRSRYNAACLGSASLRAQFHDRTRYSGLVNVAWYSRIQNSQFDAAGGAGGLTVASAVPISGDLEITGMVGCNFGTPPNPTAPPAVPPAVFTGPAGSCRLDANTNYWFKTNGATLAGGATKVIQDDLVP